MNDSLLSSVAPLISSKRSPKASMSVSSMRSAGPLPSPASDSKLALASSSQSPALSIRRSTQRPRVTPPSVSLSSKYTLFRSSLTTTSLPSEKRQKILQPVRSRLAPALSQSVQEN